MMLLLLMVMLNLSKKLLHKNSLSQQKNLKKIIIIEVTPQSIYTRRGLLLLRQLGWENTCDLIPAIVQFYSVTPRAGRRNVSRERNHQAKKKPGHLVSTIVTLYQHRACSIAGSF
jgi:hypothetical protein